MAVDRHVLPSELTHIKARCGEMPIVPVMGGRRFDIIRIGAGWWLTDSGAIGLAFPNAAEAIAEGKRRADAYDGPASVHVWDNGVPTQVHDNRDVDDADATGDQS
jgi:hypothetical protein